MFGIFKVNKIKRLRKNLADPKWLVSKYESLLYNEKDLLHYEKFECESHFKGERLASHNRKILAIDRRKNNKRIKFIESILKEVDLKYYLTFIGSLSEDEIKVLKRDNKLKKLINSGL